MAERTRIRGFAVVVVVVVEGVMLAIFPGCAAWEPFAPSSYIIVTLELNVNSLVRHVRDCGGSYSTSFGRGAVGAHRGVRGCVCLWDAPREALVQRTELCWG